MNTISTAAFGAFVIMAASAAHGQQPDVDMSATSRMDTARPDLTVVAPQSAQQSRPLFMLGSVEVHLWAPIQLPYDPHANRNFAADPFGDG
ncbi:MAG: hypothetical protein P4L71_00215 [Acetobacteraceae bacterium]|nr:hypothetical protein [Acetobacteraceae bacterium]